MSHRNPAEDGIQASREDAQRARDGYCCADCGSRLPFDHSNRCNAPVEDPAELRKRLAKPRAAERAPGATTKAARSEKRTKRAASGSANALNRALGYLEAALTELHEARARVEADPVLAMDAPERFLAEAVEAGLRQSGIGGTESIRMLRDRRAARAGFSFDD